MLYHMKWLNPIKNDEVLMTFLSDLYRFSLSCSKRLLSKATAATMDSLTATISNHLKHNIIMANGYFPIKTLIIRRDLRRETIAVNTEKLRDSDE